MSAHDDALAVRLLSIFGEELAEQVLELNTELLVLERTPADPDRLTAVFRIMHTLKGASRAAGLPQVEALCHALEHELGNARDQHAPLSGAQLALLFECADALADLRERLLTGATGDTEALSLALRHVRDRKPVARVEPRAVPPPATVVAPTTQNATGENADDHRDRVIRVSLDQVDAIAGLAGEISGFVGLIADRTERLAVVRARLRETRGDAEADTHRDVDTHLTRVLRQLSEDERTLAGISGRLGLSARRLRQRPLSELTETMPRTVRDVALELKREVQLEVTGGEIEVDRVVLEALRDPLMHLVRNAVDHGVELPEKREANGKPRVGVVRIDMALQGDRLRLTVADDGPGVDLDAIRRRLKQAGRAVPPTADRLMRAMLDDGFTTRDVATTVSGRGVGLGVVRAATERMGGSIEIQSTPGAGVAITLDVPVSVATMRVLLIKLGDALLGVPSGSVVKVLRVLPGALMRVDGRSMLPVLGIATGVRTLAALLGPPFVDIPRTGPMQVVVVESSSQRLALLVDDLVDERELVLRPVEHAGPRTAELSVGSALLGSGEVVLVLNPAALVHEGNGSTSDPFAARPLPTAKARILVADDSMTSRTLESSVLTAAGYDVLTAVDGAAAWRIIDREELDLVVSDVEMPHLDGFELCTRIRGNARTARLPVVLVTSLDSDDQRARGLAAGADAYISKSGFDQDALLDTVRMLIGGQRGALR